MNKIDRILNLFKSLESKLDDIKLVHLTSIDGFPICTHFFNKNSRVPEDKLSAAASSMTSLSMAAAKQLIGSRFESTSIETKNGNMLLVRTKFESKDCILCFVTGNNHKIGKVRYFAFKLADFIQNFEVLVKETFT